MGKRLKDYKWDRVNGIIPNHNETVKQVRNLLNTTGPGFCLAKFRQVTLHLGTGLVHSCHHPSAHKIDKEQVGQDARILFNTPKLKEARKQMLNGERPPECDFCWRVEDSTNNANLMSDRHMKSSEPWALKDHDIIADYTGDEYLYPSYLEVDFSNACNLRCTYCGPEFSSKWVEDLKSKGPIKLLYGTKEKQWAQGWQDLDTLVYKNREHNPYVEAFWKWFPNAYKYLIHYRITGGEPLMSKETFKSLDWLIENPNTKLDFSINSNLSVPDKLWDKFVQKLIQLRDANSVRRITIYTSVEGWGKRAEYGRTGLDFELFQKRYEQLVALGNIRAVIMSTYNIFSVTSFEQLLEWVLELKQKHNPNKHIEFLEHDTGFTLPSQGNSLIERSKLHKGNDADATHSYIVGIDMPYLRHPNFLDARICTNDLVENHWIKSMDFIAKHTSINAWGQHQGFEDHEYEKFYRSLVHRLYFNKNKPDDNMEENYQLKVDRAKFYEFVKTKDERDDTNFVATFPEMEHFYSVCKAAAEEIKNG